MTTTIGDRVVEVVNNQDLLPPIAVPLKTEQLSADYFYVTVPAALSKSMRLPTPGSCLPAPSP